MQYRNVGNHAEDLADGRLVAPGEYIDLDEEAVREARAEDLIARGVFIPVDDQAEHEADLAERRVTRRARKEEANTEEES